MYVYFQVLRILTIERARRELAAGGRGCAGAGLSAPRTREGPTEATEQCSELTVMCSLFNKKN